MKDYQLWALASAVFAGITAILAKKGVETVPSNLAVAVRVAVVLVFAVGIAIATRQTAIEKLDGRAWMFLGLSGVATGLSWLCYFRALELGPVSAVAPIDKLSFVLAVILGVVALHEKVTANVWIGCGLIAAGVLFTLRP